MSVAPADEARAVRSGEELDVAAVDAWLKGALPALRQMAASDPADAVRLVARRAIEQIESRP